MYTIIKKILIPSAYLFLRIFWAHLSTLEDIQNLAYNKYASLITLEKHTVLTCLITFEKKSFKMLI